MAQLSEKAKQRHIKNIEKLVTEYITSKKRMRFNDAAEILQLFNMKFIFKPRRGTWKQWAKRMRKKNKK